MLEFGALLLVAQRDTEPQVPIWLQMLALALAPVLGFMGIGVGALLQSRSSRKAKLRDDRRTTYLAFAKDVHDFYQWFGIEGIKSADHRPGVDPKRHLKDVSEQIGRIQAVSYEVDLIASSRAAAACSGCVKEVLVSQVFGPKQSRVTPSIGQYGHVATTMDRRHSEIFETRLCAIFGFRAAIGSGRK